MKTIFKYQLLSDQNPIVTHTGARIVHIAIQHDMITAWAEVETTNDPETLMLYVVGTGQPIPLAAIDHVGSSMTDSGNFVFHVYAGVTG